MKVEENEVILMLMKAVPRPWPNHRKKLFGISKLPKIQMEPTDIGNIEFKMAKKEN